MRRTICLVLFFAIVRPLLAQQQEDERFVKIINRLVEAMNNQDYNGIVREYDKGMSTAFPLFKTTYFFKNNFDTFGKVIKVDPPQIRAADQAVFVMHSERGIQDLTLYIDDQGKIKGFLFTTHVASEPPSTSEPSPAAAQTSISPSTQPATQKTTVDSSAISEKLTVALPSTTPSVAPVIPDKQETALYLPFTGTWAVIAGGEFREGAPQRNILQQQYAYEFSGTDASGLRYKNDGKANEDYVGYGREIVAPANGLLLRQSTAFARILPVRATRMRK